MKSFPQKKKEHGQGAAEIHSLEGEALYFDMGSSSPDYVVFLPHLAVHENLQAVPRAGIISARNTPVTWSELNPPRFQLYGHARLPQQGYHCGERNIPVVCTLSTE